MIWLLQRVLLVGRGSLESLPNNEALLLLAFLFNGHKTVPVAIFRLSSSGAIGPTLHQEGRVAVYCQNLHSGMNVKMFSRGYFLGRGEIQIESQSPAC